MFKLWLSWLARICPHQECCGVVSVVGLLGLFVTHQGSICSLTVKLLQCPCPSCSQQQICKLLSHYGIFAVQQRQYCSCSGSSSSSSMVTCIQQLKCTKPVWLQVADNLPLYGVCCYMDEMLHRAPSLLKAKYPDCNMPLSRYMVSAPRCYCFLTHYPFFSLHMKVRLLSHQTAIAMWHTTLSVRLQPGSSVLFISC